MKTLTLILATIITTLSFAQDFSAVPKENNVLFVGVEYEMNVFLEKKEKIVSVESDDYFKITYTEGKLKVTPMKEGNASFTINTNKRKGIKSNTFTLSKFPDPILELDEKMGAGNQVTMLLQNAKKVTLKSTIQNFSFKFLVKAYIIQQLDADGNLILEYKKKGAGLNGKAQELLRSLERGQKLKIRAKIVAPNGDTRYVETLINAI